MNAKDLRAPGMTLVYHPCKGWVGRVEYMSWFVFGADRIEGCIGTTQPCLDLTATVDRPKAAAEAIGVRFEYPAYPGHCPRLEVEGVDVDTWLPIGWIHLLQLQAIRLGWVFPYTADASPDAAASDAVPGRPGLPGELRA